MFFFFFNDTATTEIYTLSLHDALPICGGARRTHDLLRLGLRREALVRVGAAEVRERRRQRQRLPARDRKSTRLNSSHGYISYAVFCLKKKQTTPSSPSTTNTSTHTRNS